MQCNKNHNKRGSVSQFANISDCRNIQSTTEFERNEIHGSTHTQKKKPRDNLGQTDTQQ